MKMLWHGTDVGLGVFRFVHMCIVSEWNSRGSENRMQFAFLCRLLKISGVQKSGKNALTNIELASVIRGNQIVVPGLLCSSLAGTVGRNLLPSLELPRHTRTSQSEGLLLG
jgi:hypothetical protein